MHKMLADSAENHHLSINTKQCLNLQNMGTYAVSDLFFSCNMLARYFVNFFTISLGVFWKRTSDIHQM